MKPKTTAIVHTKPRHADPLDDEENRFLFESKIETMMLFRRQSEVITAMRRGVSVAGLREPIRLTNDEAKALVNRIRERWQADDLSERGAYKSAAMRRMYDYIQSLRMAEDPDWAAIARFEAQLSDIQGTKEPIATRVEHVMSNAMQDVMTGMSNERIAQIIREQHELRQLAEKARSK